MQVERTQNHILSRSESVPRQLACLLNIAGTYACMRQVCLALLTAFLICCAPAIATPWEGYCLTAEKYLKAAQSKKLATQRAKDLSQCEYWYKMALQEATGWGTDSEIYGRSLSYVAATHLEQGRSKLALTEFKNAIKILEKFPNGYLPDLATAYERVASLEQGQQARIYKKKAATIRLRWSKQVNP